MTTSKTDNFKPLSENYNPLNHWFDLRGQSHTAKIQRGAKVVPFFNTLKFKIMNIQSKIDSLKAKITALANGRTHLQVKDSADYEAYNKMYKEYRRLELQQREEQKNIELLKAVNEHNELQTVVKKVCTLLVEYKGNFLLATGGHTKKFKDFLESSGINSIAYVYAKPVSYTDSVEFVISTKGVGNNRKTVHHKDLESFESNQLTFEEVEEARKKYNELLEQKNLIESQLSSLYSTATVNYTKEGHGRNYSF